MGHPKCGSVRAGSLGPSDDGRPSSGPAQSRYLINLGAENDSASRELARAVADVSSTYFPPIVDRAAKETPPGRPHSNLVRISSPFHPVIIFRRDRYLRGGDHTSFNAEGFTAVRITEWRENFNHQHQNVRVENGIQYGDLLQYVDFDYVANVARLNATTLASLASAPAPPGKVHILTKALVNDSTLTWEPSPDGLATGYLVLWRDTGASDWEHAQAFGNVTQATLPMSKDNVIFAVQATDANGHRSLPVVIAYAWNT